MNKKDLSVQYENVIYRNPSEKTRLAVALSTGCSLPETMHSMRRASQVTACALEWLRQSYHTEHHI